MQTTYKFPSTVKKVRIEFLTTHDGMQTLTVSRLVANELKEKFSSLPFIKEWTVTPDNSPNY